MPDGSDPREARGLSRNLCMGSVSLCQWWMAGPWPAICERKRACPDFQHAAERGGLFQPASRARERKGCWFQVRILSTD